MSATWLGQKPKSVKPRTGRCIGCGYAVRPGSLSARFREGLCEDCAYEIALPLVKAARSAASGLVGKERTE
jgi:hypothetical protein